MEKLKSSLVGLIETYIHDEEWELPPYPDIAFKIQEELNGEEPDLKAVGRHILADQALAARILKTANSAFYKGLHEITSLDQAVTRLGGREVLSQVFTYCHGRNYQFQDPELNRIAELTWRHALAVGIGARWLARRLGYQSKAQTAYMAGLLHDVGDLFLLSVMDSLRHREGVDLPITQALVAECLLHLHAEQGARLLEAWNLPEIYCTITRTHHEEEFDAGEVLNPLVRMADNAAKKLGITLHPEPDLVLSSCREAQVLHLNDVAAAELEIEVEDAMEEYEG